MISDRFAWATCLAKYKALVISWSPRGDGTHACVWLPGHSCEDLVSDGVSKLSKSPASKWTRTRFNISKETLQHEQGNASESTRVRFKTNKETLQHRQEALQHKQDTLQNKQGICSACGLAEVLVVRARDHRPFRQTPARPVPQHACAATAPACALAEVLVVRPRWNRPFAKTPARPVPQHACAVTTLAGVPAEVSEHKNASA